MEWFLILGIYGCHVGDKDNWSPPACYNRDQRLSMPSREVCEVVRDANGGDCVALVADPSLWRQPGNTILAPKVRARD